MPSSKNIIVILLSICLIFKEEALAQTSDPSAPLSAYTLTFRGARSPYDTSVNISITEYRKIRQKVTLADSLIAALHVEINKGLALSIAQEERSGILVSLVDRHERTIAAKDKTIADLSKQFDDLDATITAPKKWYRTNGFKYGAGATGVLVIRRILISLLR
jgi:hypothetical protein